MKPRFQRRAVARRTRRARIMLKRLRGFDFRLWSDANPDSVEAEAIRTLTASIVKVVPASRASTAEKVLRALGSGDLQRAVQVGKVEIAKIGQFTFASHGGRMLDVSTQLGLNLDTIADMFRRARKGDGPV